MMGKKVSGNFKEFFEINSSGSLEFTFCSGSKSEIIIFLKNVSGDSFFKFKFLEDECEAEIKILFFSSQRLKSNSSAEIFCEGKNNKINLDIRGIVKNDSNVFFKAKGIIEENAENTDLSISEKAMFDGKARVEFLPILKIENNNVKAGHTASVKKFFQDNLFYLMSRGIDKENSKKLLFEGFLNGFPVKIEDF